MTRAAIVRAGAWAPTGTTPTQVAMVARAGHLHPRDTRFVDRRGEPIGMATAPGLDASLTGCDRATELAAVALAQLGVSGMELPVMLSVPELGRPGDDPRYEAAILATLASETGLRPDPRRSRIVRVGRSGFAVAMEEALAALADGAVPAVVVGGVDTHFHRDTLAWLDEEDRLLAPERDDGFIPGEGAAFVLLSARPDWAAPRATRVVSARSAPEPSIAAGGANLASALTGLVAAALEVRQVGWLFTDLNAERGRTAELLTALHRCSLGVDVPRVDGSQWFGDAGAAVGALATAAVHASFGALAAPATTALVALSSDGPSRGTVLIEAGT